MKENKNTTNSTTSEERMNTIQAYQGKDEEMREGGKYGKEELSLCGHAFRKT